VSGEELDRRSGRAPLSIDARADSMRQPQRLLSRCFAVQHRDQLEGAGEPVGGRWGRMQRGREPIEPSALLLHPAGIERAVALERALRLVRDLEQLRVGLERPQIAVRLREQARRHLDRRPDHGERGEVCRSQRATLQRSDQRPRIARRVRGEQKEAVIEADFATLDPIEQQQAPLQLLDAIVRLRQGASSLTDLPSIVHEVERGSAVELMC
jgi:hypothetical protein